MDTFKRHLIEHGGDWSGFLLERGRLPLDFSANVSPLGMPRRAREAAAKLAFSDGLYDVGLSAYPDPACRSLRRAIAAKYGVRYDRIFCANGAADILYRLALAERPARALLVAPDFGEYARALKTVGTEITYCRADGHIIRPLCGNAPAEIAGNMFTLTDSFADHINEDTDLVIFSNPNNPSGTAAERDILGRILEKCIACGALLVVDECFLDFLPDAEERTMLSFLPRSDGHLMVVRAFTKFYGMAGLRLGWCASSPERLDALQEAGPPWQVSTIAQAAGEAALSDAEYEEKLRALICRERTFLAEALRDLGYFVIDGQANFLLFHSPDGTLHEYLREKGIMIRDCGNYPGLSRGWYRIAVRTHEDNSRLLSHLRLISDSR